MERKFIIERARRQRREMRLEERILWQQLRRRQLNGAKFRRQAMIGGYIVDFACFQRRLVVEADGGCHEDASVDDQRRDRNLERLGFRVLRLSSDQILYHLPQVLLRIKQHL